MVPFEVTMVFELFLTANQRKVLASQMVLHEPYELWGQNYTFQPIVGNVRQCPDLCVWNLRGRSIT